MLIQCPNRYAQFLADSGSNVWSVDGVDWFSYNGFLRPAYLPHATPLISRQNARQALKKSGSLFARWDSDFGCIENGDWWYVTRQGHYSLDLLSGNTRSKIRRGAKRLTARLASIQEVSKQGYEVCQNASARYKSDSFLPDRDLFNRKLDAAVGNEESIEFFGVYSDDKLVGFSENHIQDNAVFWESIWYDPAFLGDYSSYLLTHEMLSFYLNDRHVQYVSDGCRSLYHDTNVQDFFVNTFGFTRQFARLHVLYSSQLKPLVSLIYPIRHFVHFVNRKWRTEWGNKIGGLMLQEGINRSYFEDRQSESP